MNKKMFSRLYGNLDRLVNDGSLAGKFIILFGANKPAEITISFLHNRNIKVDAIIDNSSGKQNKTLKGVMVYAPDDLLKESAMGTMGETKAPIIILIASLYYKQMRSSIAKYNIDDSQIIETLYFAEYSVDPAIFRKNADAAMNGWSVYSGIKSAYGNDCFIILIPCPSLGDAYFILSYMGEYIRQTGLKNYVIAMSGAGSARVAEMFEAQNCINITQDENDALLAFYTLMDLTDVKVVSHNYPYTRLPADSLGLKMLNWGEMIKEVILGLGPAVRTQIYENANRKPAFPADKYKIKSGKTVLLAPAAVHAISLPDSFWDALAEALGNEGYTVRVNVAADESINIKGAESLFIPLEDIIPFVETAGIFISLRNGLCDILSEATATKIALYPNEDYFDFFGIEKIGLTDSFTEILYDNDRETIARVMEQLRNPG